MVAMASYFPPLVIAGCSGAEIEGGLQDGALSVALFLVDDRAELAGLVEKAELNGCTGRVISAGEGGFGPDAESGRYGLRIEQPLAKIGTCIRVKAANLRLRASARR